MKLGFTNGKDCPPCGCMLAGVQAPRTRKPRAMGRSRMADFDIKGALSLWRAILGTDSQCPPIPNPTPSNGRKPPVADAVNIGGNGLISLQDRGDPVKPMVPLSRFGHAARQCE